MRRHSLLLVGTALCFSLASVVEASLNYTTPGATVGQDFNTLASSGTGNTWSNDTTDTGTLDGWYLFNSTGAAITTYAGGPGSSGTGAYYSFGTAAADRALGGVGSGGAYFGSPASGAIAGWIAFAVTNNTGLELDSFTVGFDGEQWRDGGNPNMAAQSMVLEYGFGNSFGAVGTWIAPGGAFDWTSPVAATSAAPVDGNVAGNVANRGGTISNLSWTNGDRMWIRWVERNDTGNDHGLSIDDFEFSANYTPDVVPEPASLLAWGGIGLLSLGLIAWKKHAA